MWLYLPVTTDIPINVTSQHIGARNRVFSKNSVSPRHFEKISINLKISKSTSNKKGPVDAMRKKFWFILISVIVLLSCKLPGSSSDGAVSSVQPTLEVQTEIVQQPPPTAEIPTETTQPVAQDAPPAEAPADTNTPTITPSPTIPPYQAQLLVDNSNWVFYVLNVDGSGVAAVIQGFGAVWSPDGNKIVYVSTDDDLFVSDIDGSNAVNLTNGSLVCRSPGWFPDGSQIVFHGFASEDSDSDLYLIIA
jgi:hypothetical protein